MLTSVSASTLQNSHTLFTANSNSSQSISSWSPSGVGSSARLVSGIRNQELVNFAKKREKALLYYYWYQV
jgi:hypothetical protein